MMLFISNASLRLKVIRGSGAWRMVELLQLSPCINYVQLYERISSVRQFWNLMSSVILGKVLLYRRFLHFCGNLLCIGFQLG